MKNPILIFLLIVLCFSESNSIELKRVINLRGKWLFEIGDNENYALAQYDDSNWEKMPVPARWENHGYPGYDGFAWYRTSFYVESDFQDKVLYLSLGRIDDVDDVYLNGQFLDGSGSMPPQFSTAYNIGRKYYIPKGYLNYGEENVIAIRIYDDELAGGIIEGKIGIYERTDLVDIKVDLVGTWKFNTGDEMEWAKSNYNDSGWDNIKVPAKWETQGYQDYDGYAWYRTHFSLPNILVNEKLVLALGKIDDIDQVYFNGELVGTTGRFPGEKFTSHYNEYWDKDRFYRIPDHLIKTTGENIIAVRVYDVWLDGGIYSRPVGLTTLNEYKKYLQGRSVFQQFTDWLFNRWDE
jgi:hypothetical protein